MLDAKYNNLYFILRKKNGKNNFVVSYQEKQNNPQYFNKNKVRKSSRKQQAKSKVISLIKLLKDDDPRISLLLSDVAEPIHIVK